MSAKTQIRVEDYLRMTFEYDAEFVRGEVAERSMPNNSHSTLQFLILLQLGALAQSRAVFPRPELRLKLATDLYRIPDISVFAKEPTDEVPSAPPLLIIEILSPDDRYSEVIEKLEEYQAWGVENIWVVDAPNRRLALYSAIGLQNVSSLTLPQYSFEITAVDLFSGIPQ